MTPPTFDFPDEWMRYDRAQVALLPCPFDGTSTWAKGADRGPEAILRACPQLESYDVELRRTPGAVGITTLPGVDFDGDDPEQAVHRIQAAAARPLDDGKFVIGLGGEHTVSVGLTRALRERRGSFSVLQVDAHLDLRDDYEGSPYNHACVMRRMAEDDPDAAIVSVAIRAACEEEVEYAERRGIHVVWGHELANQDWLDHALARLSSPVYVTLDLDGLDPSILPSTGTPVPGGIGWYQTLRLLRAVGERHEVIGCDLVELKPDPVNHHSEFLAAQLIYKYVGYFLGVAADRPLADR